MDVYVKGEKKRRGDWFLLFLSIVILIISGVFFSYTQFPDFFQSKSKIEKSDGIGPTEPIVINFSKPVIVNHLRWKVEVYPEIRFNYKLEDKNRRLIIYPEKYWQLENKYKIKISGRNCLLSYFNDVSYFNTEEYPKLAEFYPAPDSKDVLLDIEDPIKATFDKSIDRFKFKFVVVPFIDLDYEIDEDTNSIKLMPKDDLERGKKYTIGSYVRYENEGDEKYRKIGETSFETKPMAPQNWDKDFTIRLEQAKRFTDCKIKEGKYIDINVASQVMVTFENGKALDAYMVSSGKRGMETPEGTYHIANKTPRAWSKEYGLFMPYWQALVPSGKFGIHELPEWPGGYKEGQNHLGTPVSHGCVRLGVGPAKTVYDWTEIGTTVIVHY